MHKFGTWIHTRSRPLHFMTADMFSALKYDLEYYMYM